MTTDSTPARPDNTCCGGGMDWQPKKGKPLIHACQLCPASPIYWRHDQVLADEGVRT